MSEHPKLPDIVEALEWLDHWAEPSATHARTLKAEIERLRSPAPAMRDTFLSDLWIGVNLDGIEDLGTLHVDEHDCQVLIDEIYGTGSAFVPTRCTLSLRSPAPAEEGREAAPKDVLAERERQKSVEGWTAKHDDAHSDGSMALAAASYAIVRVGTNEGRAIDLWPWGWDWWKPRSHRENLVRAGALILAEIERLDRATPSSGRDGGNHE